MEFSFEDFITWLPAIVKWLQAIIDFCKQFFS